MTTDSALMEEAILLSKQCVSVPTAYNVGAILVSHSHKFTGYSREMPGNTHAEQVCLLKYEKACLLDPTIASDHFDLFTTMEPCSKRNSGLESCTDRLIKSNIHIKRILIAANEPDHFVQCKGLSILKDHGYKLVHMPEYAPKALEANRHVLQGL